MSILSAPLSAVFIAASLASTPLQDKEDNGSRVLDEIETRGQQFELGPQTGEFFIRPVMYTQFEGGNSPALSVELFFSPVEEIKDGVARIYSEQKRSRYRVSVGVPVANPTGTRIKQFKGNKIDLGTRRLKLPGGSYALSEIRYFITPVSTPFGRGAGPLVNNGIRVTRSYCLSEETYIFDVKNGESQFFGALALTPFPSNSAKWREHYPVIGIDSSLEHLSGRAARESENIQDMDFDLVALEPSDGLCGTANYTVAALAP
ncbi:MAG: hypothetical protein AAF950_07385 [Pseudomonadota bacterium]